MMQTTKRKKIYCNKIKGEKGVFQMWNASQKYTAYTIVP